MRVIRSAADRGVTLFDTAEGYGPFVNEELVSEALQRARNQLLICKGLLRKPQDRSFRDCVFSKRFSHR